MSRLSGWQERPAVDGWWTASRRWRILQETDQWQASLLPPERFPAGAQGLFLPRACSRGTNPLPSSLLPWHTSEAGKRGGLSEPTSRDIASQATWQGA